MQAACEVIKFYSLCLWRLVSCCKPNWQHNPSLFRSERNNLQGKKPALQKCLVSALSLMCCLFCLFVYFNLALAQPEMLILIVQLCKKQDLLKLRSFRHCSLPWPCIPRHQAAKPSLVALQVLKVVCSALCMPLFYSKTDKTSQKFDISSKIIENLVTA